MLALFIFFNYTQKSEKSWVISYRISDIDYFFSRLHFILSRLELEYELEIANRQYFKPSAKFEKI